ncbi:MAG: hypothetical protein KY476_26205, partial [Planctomycetes bacterium]|nr:hypothetical protein [Planctomycetota bacterium]
MNIEHRTSNVEPWTRSSVSRPRLLLVTALALAAASRIHVAAADEPTGRATVIVVVGASGTPEYGGEFARWADRWLAAANRSGARTITIGPAPRVPPLTAGGPGGVAGVSTPTTDLESDLAFLDPPP